MTALVLPRNYTVVEQEEMTYLDGGWSGTTFKKNFMGLKNKVPPAFFSTLGVSSSWISAMASWSYAVTVARLGVPLIGMSNLVGGIIAGAIAAMAVGVAVTYLGNNRVFY